MECKVPTQAVFQANMPHSGSKSTGLQRKTGLQLHPRHVTVLVQPEPSKGCEATVNTTSACAVAMPNDTTDYVANG